MRDGELPASTDAEQVAFSLEALASGMNPARHLLGDGEAVAWTMRAMRAVMGLPEF